MPIACGRMEDVRFADPPRRQLMIAGRISQREILFSANKRNMNEERFDGRISGKIDRTQTFGAG